MKENYYKKINKKKYQLYEYLCYYYDYILISIKFDIDE